MAAPPPRADQPGDVFQVCHVRLKKGMAPQPEIRMIRVA